MKRYIVPVILALLSFLVALLLSSPLSPLEDQLTALKYRVRGDQKADSNIVLIYIDTEAIKDLQWPVRRNYYALMINALTDLKARAIGIDVLFENPNHEYPEYDQLLEHVVARAKNVVLSAYFEKLILGGWKLARVEGGTGGDSLYDAFDYPQVSDVYRLGDGLHLPIKELLKSAAGVGHVNVEEDRTLSLFIGSEKLIVPSLGTEVLRVASGAKRENLRYDHETLALRKEGKLLEMYAPEGKVDLNFPGRITSFTTYPFLEVLKSYDAARGGHAAVIPVQNLKNKIVLLGVIAEGRSETWATPVDPRFPSLGLHAVFLDNALRSGFLRTAPGWIVYSFASLFGFCCAWFVLGSGSKPAWLIPVIIFVTILITSFLSFTISVLVIPLSPFIIVGLIASTSALFYKHRFLREQLQSAQSEKEKITMELRDKEAKVAMLERELISIESKKSEDRTNELLEDIRRYKAEIHALNARKDDMEEALVADAGAISTMKNFEGIVYESGGPMQSVVDFVAKIAQSEASVLVLGDSGTGKEMIARAIHKLSSRAEKSFVAVNCGALSEGLLESELFGHEKGAFTGAIKDKLGRFELADGGSIFLDEIGEVNEGFQLKLLRVLQEGEFERVGGTKTIKVNVRVIAATNKDLKQLVKEKKFREDVYYRLNVLSIELPSLSERPGDIPLLINLFLQREVSETKVSRNVLDTLQNYSWRGNIRELESVITRAVLLAKADKRSMITMKDLSDEIISAANSSIAIEDQILESLREKGFSRSAISETAGELGNLNRGTVAEYLRGQCLKAFVDHTYDLDTTVRYISLSTDPAVNDRVKKKMQEYLANLADAVDVSKSWEEVKPLLRPKMKNLPQKYHPYLEQVSEAFYRRVWKAE